MCLRFRGQTDNNINPEYPTQIPLDSSCSLQRFLQPSHDMQSCWPVNYSNTARAERIRRRSKQETLPMGLFQAGGGNAGRVVPMVRLWGPCLPHGPPRVSSTFFVLTIGPRGTQGKVSSSYFSDELKWFFSGQTEDHTDPVFKSFSGNWYHPFANQDGLGGFGAQDTE